MKLLYRLCAILYIASSASLAQQPQTQTAPLSAINAKYVNGVAPGYWPTAGGGLTLGLTAGTANCAGAIVTYLGGSLTMTASVPNFVYLDTAAACAPAVKTTTFTASDIPIATVSVSGTAITAISDVRTMMTAPSSPSVGGGSFAAITSGSNTGAAMVVASGATIGASGTGIINATAENGVSCTGVPTAGQVCVATSSTTATWQTVAGSSFSVNSTPVTYAVDTGTVNNSVVTLSPGASGLAIGLTFSFKPAFANTSTNPQINLNGLGNKFITKYGGAALVAGDLSTAAIATVKFDGSNFQLQNPQVVFPGLETAPTTTQTILSSTSGAVPLQVATNNGGSSNVFTVDSNYPPGTGQALRVDANNNVYLASGIFLPYNSNEICDQSGCFDYLSLNGLSARLHGYGSVTIDSAQGGNNVNLVAGGTGSTGNQVMIQNSYQTVSVSADGDVVALVSGTNYGVSDVAVSGTNAIGIQISHSGSVSGVLEAGSTNVNLDATQTVANGDYICVSSTTSGKLHDNGTTPCTTQKVGYVVVAGSGVTVAGVHLKF